MSPAQPASLRHGTVKCLLCKMSDLATVIFQRLFKQYTAEEQAHLLGYPEEEKDYFAYLSDSDVYYLSYSWPTADVERFSHHSRKLRYVHGQPDV